MKTITELLTESQMSAVMVAEQIDSNDCSPLANAAYNAINKADNSPSPANTLAATKAATAWIAANDDAARKIIQRRLDKQAASLARRGY